MRFTPLGGVLDRDAPPLNAIECIVEPVANSARASDATDGGVRTLDQSLARRFGVDGRVGSQALGGGERAEAILAVFVVLVPASHGVVGLAGCLAQ